MSKVPADKSAAVDELFRFGIEYRTIAQLSGVSQSSIHNIKRGNFQYVRSSTEEKILAVRKLPSARRSKGRLVSPLIAKKHLLELKRKGAIHEAIAAVAGTTLDTLQRLLRDKTPRIFEDTERKILAVNVRKLLRHKFSNGRRG